MLKPAALILMLASAPLAGCSRSAPSISENTAIKSSSHSLLSPQSQASPSPVATPTLGELDWPEWQKRWWLDRASKALRGGVGIRPTENLAPYLARTREQIVADWISGFRFADTVLDFNLFHFGFRQDRIRQDAGVYAETAYMLPQAMSSAREVLRGSENWAKLFEFEQSPFLSPIRSAYVNVTQPGDDDLESAQLREAVLARIRENTQAMIDRATNDPSFKLADFCATFDYFGDSLHDMGQLGISRDFVNMNVLSPEWYGKLYGPCGDPTNPYFADFDLAGNLRELQAKNERLFAMIPGLMPANYATIDVGSARPYAPADFGSNYRVTQFSYPLQRVLLNSSTNYNRKRAAYVLKRFFCDDLTPINVEVPSSHAQGAHGSDPSCYSCHYKLDPMAGFFRNHGRGFRDYSERSSISFDDGAYMPRESFVQAWRNPPGSAREWNVGYIRSSIRQDLNTYGSTIEDLFRIIQTAPEARRCVVKRLFEYYVSPSQAIDPGYLDELTRAFIRDWDSAGSSTALKEASKKIVLGNTFSTPRTRADECYDRPSGAAGAQGGPPCRVAHLVQTHCAACHRGSGGAGGLDLQSWTQDAQGQWGFTQVLSGGTRRPVTEVFQSIVDRLSHIDDPASGLPRRRMPLGIEMPTSDREALYLWAEQQARATGGSQP